MADWVCGMKEGWEVELSSCEGCGLGLVANDTFRSSHDRPVTFIDQNINLAIGNVFIGNI